MKIRTLFIANRGEIAVRIIRAAQELGIDPNRIEVIVDTTRELGFGQTTGSRGTLMGAGSVAEACLRGDSGGTGITTAPPQRPPSRATKMPTTIASCCKDPSRPRISAGETSAM